MSDAAKHATFGGSNCHRWLACAASPRLSALAPPRPPSPEAEEGTRAHALLAACLTKDARPVEGRWPREIVDSVNFALDVIAGMMAEGWELVSVERYYDYPQSILPHEDVGGTPDTVLRQIGFGNAWCYAVVDFKHGAGVEVDTWEQHLFYAACALLGTPFDTHSSKLLTIQPRSPKGRPVKEYPLDPIELANFHVDVLDALSAAQNPAATPSAGPHCRWCPAEMTCPAREQRALQVAHDTFASVKHIDMTVLPEVRTVPVDKLAILLESAPLLRSYLDEAEKYALELARGGTTIPGFKVVEAQARRKWVGDAAEVMPALYEITQDPDVWERFAPRQLVGITEAEAMLVRAARDAAPRGKKDAASAEMKERFAFLTTKQSSGNLTLVPLSDERPAIDRPKQLFGSVVLPTTEGD